MTRQQQVFALFQRATDIPETELERFLDQECAQDMDLRKRVEQLLSVRNAAQNFLPDEALSGSTVEANLPHDNRYSANGQLGTNIGPYKLLQEIGEGGFGVVYMAAQQEPVRRQVALKIIKPGMDSREVIARFEAERQTLALMDHPSIARVFDAGQTENGRPYFVMELVKGLPITEFCDKHNLNTSERLQLFISVCQAVQHAHQKGVIHRDLKPSNILITLDGCPTAKVIDFGVAKAINQRLTEKTLFTRLGQMIGTPQYMSPEQAEMSGLDVDTRSDIYSLGVLLYELLTGTTPLDAERLRTVSYSEMQRIIHDEEPLKPSSRLSKLGENLTVICQRRQTDERRLRRTIRGDLDWIVMKALDKRRDRRYETANGLAMDVQRHLSDEPILAGRPSATYRFSKWARRNKVVFAAGTVSLVALIVGLAAASWGFVQATHQRNLAEAAERSAVAERNDLERRNYLMHVWNADTAIHDRDYHRARFELNMCPTAPRGWEWAFQQKRISDVIPAVFPGSNQHHPVYSRDGKYLVTIGVPGTSNERKALFWDLASNRIADEFEHDAKLLNVALSPNGTIFAGLGEDRTIIVWDRATKRRLWHANVTENRTDGLAISPDNQLIAVATWEGTLKVFDIQNGELKCSVTIDEGQPRLRKVTFSPDGRWIAVGAQRQNAGTAALVNVSTGKLAKQFPIGSAVPTFSPEGRIAVGMQGKIVLWNWDVDHQTLSEEAAWTVDVDGFSDLCFSGDGTHLASVGLPRTPHLRGTYRVQVWEVATQREINSIDGIAAYWLAMHPTQHQVAHLTHNDSVRLWNYKSETGANMVVPIPNGKARFSPDGKLLALGNDNRVKINDSKIEILDAASGKSLNTINGRLAHVPWMPDSRQIVVSQAEPASALEVRDAITGAIRYRIELSSTSGFPEVSEQSEPWQLVPQSYVSQDGSQVTTIDDMLMRTWSVDTGKLTEDRLPQSAHHALSGDLLAMEVAYTIEILDTDLARVTHKLPMPARGTFVMKFTRDGKRLFVGSNTGVLTLHDLTVDAKSDPQRFVIGDVNITRLVLSPDETQLAASDLNNRIIIWDVETTQPLIALEGQVEDWSCDGKRIQRIAISTVAGVQVWTLPAPPLGGIAVPRVN